MSMTVPEPVSMSISNFSNNTNMSKGLDIDTVTDMDMKMDTDMDMDILERKMFISDIGLVQYWVRLICEFSIDIMSFPLSAYKTFSLTIFSSIRIKRLRVGCQLSPT